MAGRLSGDVDRLQPRHPRACPRNCGQCCLFAQDTVVTTGNRLQLQFPSQAGIFYTIEYTADLTPPVVWETWTTLTGNGEVLQIDDFTTSAETRFYRVRVE